MRDSRTQEALIVMIENVNRISRVMGKFEINVLRVCIGSNVFPGNVLEWLVT